MLVFFLCCFGAAWSIGVGYSVLHFDADARMAYRNGDYQTVEGIVTDFHPMPPEGHQDECFSVQDQRFCYSDFDMAVGFHNAASHGGPIRAGLPVRIAYRENQILKLEVPPGTAPTPAQATAITAEGERQWQQKAENDPFIEEMQTAVLFTMVCWTLWWNLQWRYAIRFWMKPPRQPWVELAFRAFFALSFVGAVVELTGQLHSHPLSRQNLRPTIKIAGLMCAAVAMMSASTVWKAHRRDAKDNRL